MANKWHTVEEDLKNKELFLKNLELKNPIVFNTYKILSPYYNSKSKIKVQCPNDHRIWEVTPHDLLKGRHCPMCNISKGEDTIKNIVESMGLEYHTQFSFPDLVTNYSKKPIRLRYDGYIPKYKLLIEYNGEHHYSFIPKYYSNGLIDFRICLENDMRKEDYAKRRGFNFLVIPYTEQDNIKVLITQKIEEIERNTEKKIIFGLSAAKKC